MQNLKDVLKETKDSVINTGRPSGEDTNREEASHLLSGVHFIQGDIFDVVSTVIKTI